MSQAIVGSVATQDKPLVLGTHVLQSRLIVGTGKYSTYELMQQCLEASGSEVITVAVRRERLIDAEGRSILDFIDLSKYTILPNTAGCFNAEDAVRVARLGLGCRFPEEEREKIVNWTQSFSHPVPLFQAKQSATHFRLEMETFRR